MKKYAIIIPAYNEAQVIKTTLLGLRRVISTRHLLADLIVVDDGSSDSTKQISSRYADVTISHRRNCGLGASISTGIEYAKRHNYDYLITFDADGQHNPSDILKIAKALESGSEVVIGSRFLGTHQGMPLSRRIILFLGDIITYLFFGIRTTDSQSGFRGLSRLAIDNIRLKSNRMEVSSEFFGEIKRLKLKYCEVPITVSYTSYSLSKGQRNHQGFTVLVKLLYGLFR